MVKLSTLAKLTHAKYGRSSQPATFEQPKNAAVEDTIASQGMTISTNAQPG